MQAIFLIGFIFIFSLDEIYCNSKCYKSKICIHTDNEKCGKNTDGEVRRFIDSCDMKEFNCLHNTDYIPTDYKECEDLPKPDDNVLEEPDRNKSEDLEEPDEYDDTINNDKKESSESSKPEKHTKQPEEQNESAYIDVKESEELPTEKLDENINESVELEAGIDNDVNTKVLSKEVVEEFDPKENNEVKKMTYRVTKPSFQEYESYSNVSSKDLSQNSKNTSEIIEDISDSSGEVVNLSSEETGVDNKDYYFHNQFFVARTRTD